MDDELKNQVEAIIFSCGRKTDPAEIGKLIPGVSEKAIRDAVKELKKEYDSRNSGIVLLEDGDGWKMAVREKYLDTVRKITPYMEFPKTIMETLAVIAWKQPILQSDVINIRTNKAYDHIVELEKMGFLAKEKYGRSYLLKLSQKFYDYFDLRNDSDLQKLFKNIKDVPQKGQKKIKEFDGGEEAEDVADEADEKKSAQRKDDQKKKAADTESLDIPEGHPEEDLVHGDDPKDPEELKLEEDIEKKVYDETPK